MPKTPKFIKDYIKADKEVKKWTAIKEGLKEQVNAFLQENSCEEMYWAKTSGKVTLDPLKLYSYLEKQIPSEKLEELTIRIVDLTKLDDLYLANLLEPEKIPDDCKVQGKGSERLEIVGNRARKPKDD